MDKDLKATLENIKRHMRITKVTCTRSVKGRNGDNYVGFSAAWDTIQDDVGGATDAHVSSLTQGELAEASSRGLTLRESRLASLVLGMQVDIAAHDHALASGNLTSEQHAMAIRTIKSSYSQLMADFLKNGNGSGT